MPPIISKRDNASETNGIEPVWMTIAILLPVLLSVFLLYFCYRCYRADREFMVCGMVQHCQKIPAPSYGCLLMCLVASQDEETLRDRRSCSGVESC